MHYAESRKVLERERTLAEGRLGRWTVLQRAKQAGTWKHSGKRFISLRKKYRNGVNMHDTFP